MTGNIFDMTSHLTLELIYRSSTILYVNLHFICVWLWWVGWGWERDGRFGPNQNILYALCCAVLYYDFLEINSGYGAGVALLVRFFESLETFREL